MFFGAFYNLVGNIKAVNKDVSVVLNDVFEDKIIQAQILDLNTQGQLFEKGVDSSGESLGDYSKVTVDYKRLTGQRFDHITLKDTGDFYNGFRFINQKRQFKIEAETLKEGTDLNEVYPNIIGLTDESLQEVKELITEPLIANIKAFL